MNAQIEGGGVVKEKKKKKEKKQKLDLFTIKKRDKKKTRIIYNTYI